MSGITLRKTIPVQFSAIASGDGYWGMEEGFRVDFTEIRVEAIWTEDGYNWAHVDFVHEHDVYTDETGLAYTDKGIEAAVNTFITRHPELRNIVVSVCGSEQGMQNVKFLSTDADLVKGLTASKLEALGFVKES